MVIQLDFKTDDENLNLSGTATFRRNVPIERLYIRGLAEWRHVPANIIHVNQDTIEALGLKDYAQKLSKVGVNYIGIRARSNIMLSYAVRASSRTGLQKVQDLLTKFFKAIGAQSVRFNAVDVDKAIDDFDRGNDADDY